MGFHSYQCAVIKNGQCLFDCETPEFIDNVPDRAYLFKVDKPTIKVSELKNYPYTVDTYNPDATEFKHFPYYCEIACSDLIQYYVSDLLIISPFVFDVFISEKIPFNDVSNYILEEILQNNDMAVSDPDEMCDVILNMDIYIPEDPLPYTLEANKQYLEKSDLDVLEMLPELEFKKL